MTYNPRVVHVAGKNQITTDALLRAPVGDPDSADVDLIDNTTAFAKQTIEILPAITHKLQEIQEAQKQITCQHCKYTTSVDI